MANSTEAIDTAARESYGRLVAWLSARCGSIALAEDALGDALTAAVTEWAKSGIPAKPEAWLLTVAKRRLVDQQRRGQVRDENAGELEHQLKLHLEAGEAADVPFGQGLHDRRLELMFVCAHPEIPEKLRTPLILQAVLGLTAEKIGSALLLSPSAMAQRLVRVKRSIEAKGLRFEIPDPSEFPARLGYVLDAIYAAYGMAWDAESTASDRASGLSSEALWLARLLLELLPDEAEPKGLYALLCYCESRREARRSKGGRFVPLDEQDTQLWNAELIVEGEKALWLASRIQQGGPYQTEAAIHSLHAHRARSGKTDWNGIHWLYSVLCDQYPSLGAAVGYAASFGRIGEAAQGLEVLDQLDADRVARHQPYWAVRAWLLRELKQPQASRSAYEQAIGLCSDASVRTWLQAEAERQQ